jgi:hypothetical protein
MSTKDNKYVVNQKLEHVDDINSMFGVFVDRIYPIELDIKDTTDTDRPASYLDLPLEIDSEGRLRTKLHANKGKHRREEEHSLYPYVYLLSAKQHVHQR